jgi:hypothetical protein
MQPHSPFRRELWIPIGVGIVSILGLVWIFLTSDLSESLIPPTLEPTLIPLDAGPREIEILTPPTLVIPTLEDTPPTATETRPVAYPGPPAATSPSTGPQITESPLASSAATAPNQPQSLSAAKYDDTDPNIAYDRYWTVLKNPGTANAYKGTIHISTSMGSEASFRFTGQRFNLGYQRGRNFGIVTVMIDGQSYSFHEQAFDRIWRSPQLSPGTHFVRIIHESGESINLDYIEILD